MFQKLILFLLLWYSADKTSGESILDIARRSSKAIVTATKADGVIASPSVGTVDVAKIAGCTTAPICRRRPINRILKFPLAVCFIHSRHRIVPTRAASSATRWPKPFGKLRLSTRESDRPRRIAQASLDHVLIPRSSSRLASVIGRGSYWLCLLKFGKLAQIETSSMTRAYSSC